MLLSEGQADATYQPPTVLEFGQTYYWRIDEVNAPPDSTIYRGDVWSFTVEPFAYPIENIVATASAASDPGLGLENTINGSGLDGDLHSADEEDMWLSSGLGVQPTWIQYEFDRVYKLYEMLVWNYNVQFELVLGFGVKDVTVEYSENGEDWTVLGDVEFARAPAAAAYAHNTTVDFQGVAAQYVRLTVNSGYGVLGQYGLSEVRFLYVPAHPREPQPADGATAVAVDAALAWRVGRDAAVHNVYLDAVVDTPALADTVTASSYTPADLQFGTTY